MELKKAFGTALKSLRTRKGLTQEDFSVVSSRTYLSSLERGLKGPTLEKVDSLAAVIGVHPLTLLVACYLERDAEKNLEEIVNLIRSELE